MFHDVMIHDVICHEGVLVSDIEGGMHGSLIQAVCCAFGMIIQFGVMIIVCLFVGWLVGWMVG